MAQDLRLVGIVEDEVGVPAAGNQGAGTYAVPIRLSRKPTPREAELLVRFWENPPRFGNMHRKGIARVFGDLLILDPTTIEEVRDYHKETLKLVVEATNAEEARLQREDQAAAERSTTAYEEHREKIKQISREIRFDDQ